MNEKFTVQYIHVQTIGQDSNELADLNDRVITIIWSCFIADYSAQKYMQSKDLTIYHWFALKMECESANDEHYSLYLNRIR